MINLPIDSEKFAAAALSAMKSVDVDFLLEKYVEAIKKAKVYNSTHMD